MGFTRDKEIGKGTYGVVHSGEIEYANGKKERGACKQTFHSASISGLSILREIQMLQTCSSKCIHMPKLLGVFFEDYNRKPRDIKILKRENVTFVTELLDYNGSDIFGKMNLSINTMIDISAQLFSGVAYMHNKLITHRDIKPSNILINFNPVTNKPLVKICDFGLGQYLINSVASTPETVTPCYRPPEICWGINKYGDSSDVWAVGASIYEMLTGDLFVKCSEMKNDFLFYDILKRNPNQWTEGIHKKYLEGTNTPIKINGLLTHQTIERGEPLLPRLERSKYYDRADKSKWIKFENILLSCFDYNYSKRMSCWNILNDSLFDDFKGQITEIKNEINKPKVSEIINFDVPIEVNNKKIAFFNNLIERFSKFPLRQVYHAVDLVNKIFSHPDFIETHDHVERVCCAALYFFHKFFSSLFLPVKMEIFFAGIPMISDPTKVYDSEPWSDELYYEMDEWIYRLDLKILKTLYSSFKIYRVGLFETPDEYNQTLTKNEFLKILREFLKINKWTNKSYRNMYRELYIKHIDPNYLF